MAQQTQPVWKSNKRIEFMEIILAARDGGKGEGYFQKNWVGYAARFTKPLG